MVRIFFVALFILVVSWSTAQVDKKNHWVDSAFLSLSPAEKVGQLLMISVSAMPSADETKNLNELIKSNKIGSLFFTHAGPVRFAQSVNKLQSLARIPLLISADVADGLPKTFDSTMSFYDSAVLKAVTNDSLKTTLSRETKRQIEIFNIHLNLNKPSSVLGDVIFLDARKLPVQPKVKKGETEKQAFINGNDLLLIVPENVDAFTKTVIKSLKKDKTVADRLDTSVKKILSFKYEAGLYHKQFINTDNLIRRLHTPESALLKEQIAKAAITVVKNDSSFIPVRTLDDKSFVSLSIGSSERSSFTASLSKYARFKHYSIQNSNDTTRVSANLNDQDVIIVGLFTPADRILTDFIKKLSQHHRVIISCFIDPIELQPFTKISTLLASYSNNDELQKATAQIIFGGLGAKGKLPVSISDSLLAGSGISTIELNRFSYELPEAAGMNSRVLDKIESIANEAISMGATPGVHVLVAKDGKVVYEKSFGTLSYDKKNPVTDETIFDLASITKVSATLQTVMYMQEKGLIDVNKKVSVYLPELKGSNKEDFTIKDIITHQAGLWPFLPFWAETVKDTSIWKKYYSKTESEEFPFPVAENMYASKAMKDSLWHWIIKARIRDKTTRTPYDYRYSDMGFYIMQHLAEKLLAQPMEDFLQKTIYRPLGAYTTGYLPLRRFPASQIAPTEKDTLFRKSLLIGYVHDQGAAMHGGIAGHAGLFSSANDLAKLGQMWLNKGSYGGVTFFKPETIELFTGKQYENSRRGLGWDKPTISDANGPTSMFASAKTFGHTGFTGTSIWVDPEFNLVFVFLSNRVNPDMTNNKILNANIRPRIQDVVYQSIFEYCGNHNIQLKPKESKLGLTVKP